MADDHEKPANPSGTDPRLSRRRLLQAAGAGALVVGIGATATVAAAADKTSDAASTGDEPCYKLTAEQIERPYYLDYDIVRRRITEDRSGVPLRLRLKVIDGETCRPLHGAAVDVWHCDAVQTHDGYEGGHQCHTGQFYLAEEAVTTIAKLDLYATNTITRVKLDEDSIYPGTGANGGLLNLRYDKHRIQRGVLATLTMSVDPDATHDGSDAPQPTFSGTPSPSTS